MYISILNFLYQTEQEEIITTLDSTADLVCKIYGKTLEWKRENRWNQWEPVQSKTSQVNYKTH